MEISESSQKLLLFSIAVKFDLIHRSFSNVIQFLKYIVINLWCYSFTCTSHLPVTQATPPPPSPQPHCAGCPDVWLPGGVASVSILRR